MELCGLNVRLYKRKCLISCVFFYSCSIPIFKCRIFPVFGNHKLKLLLNFELFYFNGHVLSRLLRLLFPNKHTLNMHYRSEVGL